MATETMDNATPAGAPQTIEEALESGFLPDDPNYRLTGNLGSTKKEEDDNRDEHTKSEDEQTPAGKSEEEHEEQNEDEHPEDHATPGDKGGEHAAASQAALQKGKKENRFAKLSRENRELRKKLARVEGREEGRSATATTARDRGQESRSAAVENQPRPEPKIDDQDAAGKPKYATYDDYLRDLRAWDREQIQREFQQNTQLTEQQRRQQAEQAEIGRKLNEKFTQSRAKHADFDKVALSERVIIPLNSVVDNFLQDSEHAGEVAYYLGQHPEILEGFYECSGEKNAATGKPGPYVKDAKGLKAAWRNKITPQQQFRKLMEIEAQVSKPKPAAGAASGADSGAHSSSKPITRAGRPPHQTSGQGAVTKDAAEQAVEDNDFETYAKTQNERDPRVRALRK